MNPKKHGEPAIVEVGFMPNCWGGWWFTDPDNRFTIQILPTNTIHESRDWKLGIARPRRGMEWGNLSFPAPEAAALHACRVVHDDDLQDRITQSMIHNHDSRQLRIKNSINNFMRKRRNR